MARVWFTSDWHIGHTGIAGRFRTEFADDAEHNLTLYANYTTCVNKRDVVYFLGDMIFKEWGLEKIRNLPGQKILVTGNHDMKDTHKLLTVFRSVQGAISYKGFWLTHIPIHPVELRGRKNIHGHVHYAKINDPNYISVCPENPTVGEKWYPVLFDEIKEYSNRGVHASP